MPSMSLAFSKTLTASWSLPAVHSCSPSARNFLILSIRSALSFDLATAASISFKSVTHSLSLAKAVLADGDALRREVAVGALLSDREDAGARCQQSLVPEAHLDDRRRLRHLHN